MISFILAALTAASLALSPGGSLEYEVKAAFLLNFISFTEWPSTAFDSPTSPLRICVVGTDPFGGVLARTVHGERVAGHALVVEISERTGLRGCHVVFIARTANADELALPAADTPVLIVGDSDDLLHTGATIVFAVDGGKVRFDVNQTAATVNGLRLSPRLLRVARRVR